MIKRYLSTETNLDHNKYVLHPMKAVVIEEANGIFELEIELPKGTQLNKRDLITAPTPRGIQPFRVYRITKTLYGIRAYARHIFYDLANALLIDTRPTNANVNSALQSIFTAVGWSGWTYLSDITEQKTAYYIRKNPVEAIIGADNSILNVWGGNLVRDNKEVRIYADGLDRGYEIRLGKNLIGIEDDSDDSNVVTRLYPTYEKDQVIYGIPEEYVDSPLIGNYPTPITKEIRVALTDDQKGYTDEQIYQVLRDYCNNLYAVDNVDKPVANYKVDFVELSKIARLEQEVSYNYAGLEQLTYETIETLTYDQLESVTTVQQFIDLLEQIDLYDKVKIRVKELDIDLQARVIKYQYDALAERYIKIELGGFKNSNQYQINNIIQQMKNDREKASTEYRELYDLAINQVTGNKGGYQITRLNANNEPYETLWMDTPDIETAVNVLRINQNGIAGSANGFNGPYNVAITTDGWVVAERILANQLSAISANLGTITAGYIQSADGSSYWDLDTGEVKLTGELSTYDGSGLAVRVFNRNLAYYSPEDENFRGMLSSSKIVAEGSEGISLYIPEKASRDSYFSINTLVGYNDTTHSWSGIDGMAVMRRKTNGEKYTTILSDFFASRAIQRGYITLNASTATSHTFSTVMQGAPVVVLTPVHSITGAVITAKLVSASSTGFSAIIQGSPTSSNVTFAWIAIA